MPGDLCTRFTRCAGLCAFAVAVWWGAAVTMAGTAKASDAPQGPPPSPVVTAQARLGKAALQNVFIGTIRFPEVSEVAASVAGRVERIAFEEGDSLSAGHVMVVLDTDLLTKALESASAQHAQTLTDLESARLEFARMDTLYRSKSVSEKEFDEARLRMQGLQQKAHASKAEAERLRLEIAKSTVRAPFEGVVLQRSASRGEWVAPGTVVATVAHNAYVEAMVEVPQSVMGFVRPGQDVVAAVGGTDYPATVTAVIPQGDVSTRTFPVRVRLKNGKHLAQGMEARVRLPAGAEADAVLVPRDAVTVSQGQTVVWIVQQGEAHAVHVTVDAWLGSEVAVSGTGLSEGAAVVVKGNERLRPGQRVTEGR
ncbi:efflux RND transporter periplasmic adaptor subunit [Desulfovibrio psychrotolerans]|uniref:Hemolysin D n=1 Tax=Desulfovibrio psychrotolerans TaxID=415242 RepID=A0A7J0BRV8_9BACT|nr:efflux RND transporter periplasmic adaptor subunit [Desulfovibrio psychrotolerans]GFM36446.1 hemolysin D [Desulfovibrio psychrotolerans]